MDSYGRLETTPKSPLASPEDALRDKAESYAASAKSTSTRASYAGDWRHFKAWCERAGHVPLPAAPDTLCLYLADHAGKLKPSTLSRRLVAVSQAHREFGADSPTRASEVRRVFSGIRREQGAAQRQMAPLLLEGLKAAVAALPGTTIGRRDRALLLLGWAGAFRASELAGLDVPDLRFGPRGVAVTLRKSKTDQEGAGRTVGVPNGKVRATCPIAALRDWMAAGGVKDGPLFRRVDRHGHVSGKRLSRQAVRAIVRRSVGATGLSPDGYGSHSLRAGLATSAALAGVGERSIMKQTGHKSEKMVRRYIREAELFEGNAASQAGL